MGSDSVHADPFDPHTLIQFRPSLRSDVHRSWCIVGANFIALRERSEFGCETTSRGGLVNPGYLIPGSMRVSLCQCEHNWGGSGSDLDSIPN